MYDIVGIGEPNIDLILNTEEFPRPDDFTLISACSWQGGGKVATGVVAAARLGAKCAMLGSVGDDGYGRFLLNDFTRHGVDTSGMLVRKNKRSSMAAVLSDRSTGKRSILWLPGDAPFPDQDEIPKELLFHTRIFYIAQGDQLTLSLAKQALSAGAKVLMDADHFSEDLYQILPATTIFIGSEFVYRNMFDHDDVILACRSLSEQGPDIVIFTFGKKGCKGIGPEGEFSIPAYKVPVQDTVGAGDVFHGAFAAGYLKGWRTEQCARFASAVSAIKCTRIGGRAGIPTLESALAFMETGKINERELDERVEYYNRGMV